jgi:hypothetical protein
MGLPNAAFPPRVNTTSAMLLHNNGNTAERTSQLIRQKKGPGTPIDKNKDKRIKFVF